MAREVETELMVGGRSAPDQTTIAATDTIEVGRWYWVKESGEDDRWLACVTRLGSNYARVTGAGSHGGTQSQRFHFDIFWQHCEYVADPDPIINGKMLQYQQEIRALMDEVRRVTAMLGVAHRQGLPAAANSEVHALTIHRDEPIQEYKAALIKAKDETLPDLFQKIKESNRRLATWMKVKLVPMEAETEALQGSVRAVKDRIFNVELYAGLVESVVQVREGQHAPNDTQIHLMQRRCYMDEECLVGYETGGMDYQNLSDFEKWLSKPANFNRVLPFPRTVVAFRIRRTDKEREVDLSNFLSVLAEKDADRSTFLYIRNGEALYRMETEIEFEEKLFPDTNHKILFGGKLWAKTPPGSINDLISDAEYQGRIQEEAEEDEKLKSIPEEDQWRHRRFRQTKDDYNLFTPETVYFDDMMEVIQDESKKHNRIVLILQGLLDRSPVFTPHPPWQLWTGPGFELAFALHFDDTRALSAGEKPDFETYRAKLNSRLWTGSLTVGQERAWEVREAERENRRLDNDPRDAGRYRHHAYQPPGDPGPGKLARIHRYRSSDGACTYKWTREKRRGWRTEGAIEATLVTGDEHLLNVDAYTQGDFHIFFDDPRTRREYLKWAPLLLEAEEAHAGNREMKPNRILAAAPARKPVIRAKRPRDLAPEKIRPKKPPIAEKWEGKMVRLLDDLETTKGTTFDTGEIMLVRSYERKSLTLQDPKDNMRRIRGVATYQVVLLG